MKVQILLLVSFFVAVISAAPPNSDDNATLAKLAQTLKGEMLVFLNSLGFNDTWAQDLLNDFINSQPATNKGDKLKSVLDAERATAIDVATAADEFATSLDYMVDSMGEEIAEADVKSLAEDLEKVKQELEGKDGVPVFTST